MYESDTTYTGELWSWRNLLWASLAALGLWGAWWVVSDIYHGEWKSIPAVVVYKHFQPAYTTIYMVTSCDKSSCTSYPQTQYHPAEYHVIVREESGRVTDFDNQAAFGRYEPKQPVVVKARYGRSGWRWGSTIQ